MLLAFVMLPDERRWAEGEEHPLRGISQHGMRRRADEAEGAWLRLRREDRPNSPREALPGTSTTHVEAEPRWREDEVVLLGIESHRARARPPSGRTHHGPAVDVGPPLDRHRRPTHHPHHHR